MKIDLIMASCNRPHLLELGLWSIYNQNTNHDLKIIVCNDGLIDSTEAVCQKYKNKLNIEYFYTGQRNKNKIIIRRSPGYALNIGAKQSTGEILILSCPEIFHLNDTINLITKPLLYNKKLLTIPKTMYFDDTGNTLKYLQKNNTVILPNNLLKEITKDKEAINSVTMPYLMGMMRQEYLDIRGYDEDFIGYAGADTDLVNRLKLKGLKHYRTEAKIIHLYHGSRCDSKTHWENPRWAYNYNLLLKRKGIIVRNINKKWGIIK